MIGDQEMKSCTSDAALSYKSTEEGPIGLCTTYVDNALHAGSEAFQETIKKHKQN